MSRRPLHVLLCVAAIGCDDGLVAPARPSEGVPVSLVVLAGATRSPGQQTPISASGDSVVLGAVISDPNCPDVVASAGMSGRVLVVTITSQLQTAPPFCPLIATTAVVRAVVRPAPRGSYTAVLRRRFESPTQGAQERELVRGAVVLP